MKRKPHAYLHIEYGSIYHEVVVEIRNLSAANTKLDGYLRIAAQAGGMNGGPGYVYGWGSPAFCPWGNPPRLDLDEMERVVAVMRKIERACRNLSVAFGQPKGFAEHVAQLLKACGCDLLFYDLASAGEKLARRVTPNYDQFSAINGQDEAGVIRTVQRAERQVLDSLAVPA